MFSDFHFVQNDMNEGFLFSSNFSYASTMRVTSLCRTMSFLLSSMKLIPFTPFRILVPVSTPKFVKMVSLSVSCHLLQSFWCSSPYG